MYYKNVQKVYNNMQEGTQNIQNILWCLKNEISIQILLQIY